jgi:zinc transporter ZupT
MALPSDPRVTSNARGPSGLAFLPGFLRDARQSTALYILKTWLLVFGGSIILAGMVQFVVPAAQMPEFAGEGLWLYFLLVVFAPILETLLMLPPLLILNRLFGPAPAIAGSAVLWGVLHSLAAPTWGLVAWWPFFIFSAILLIWREQRSLSAGVLVVVVIHALQNGIAGLALLFGME